MEIVLSEENEPSELVLSSLNIYHKHKQPMCLFQAVKNWHPETEEQSSRKIEFPSFHGNEGTGATRTWTEEPPKNNLGEFCKGGIPLDFPIYRPRVSRSNYRAQIFTTAERRREESGGECSDFHFYSKLKRSEALWNGHLQDFKEIWKLPAQVENEWELAQQNSWLTTNKVASPGILDMDKPTLGKELF
ncbi:uncharacterized protein [Marmota flaviventris]|uniref:uncharacterized protein isoform X3 n=1 Tax=Marmota flaviventris TaxID=93162 RepID=UPI003A846A49